jgi:hypothetical protein
MHLFSSQKKYLDHKRVAVGRFPRELGFRKDSQDPLEECGDKDSRSPGESLKERTMREKEISFLRISLRSYLLIQRNYLGQTPEDFVLPCIIPLNWLRVACEEGVFCVIARAQMNVA